MRRRDFLKATAAAAPMIVSAKALAQANETVNIGLIGLGGRCSQIAGTALGTPGVNIVSVCDIFQPRVDRFLKFGEEKGQKWNGYLDFREMIEKENLDGVMVETTTHARAWVTCNAMAMGMDAYIEKPMSLTIAEGREMVNCARKYERVTQVGTQQRSIPLNNWASDLVVDGAIGKVDHVLAPNFVGPVKWTSTDSQPTPGPENSNWWDLWTNQAEMRPYHEQLHRGWAKWWAYDGGGLCFGVTGWGAHSYDQINRGLGTNETGPTQIVLEEPAYDGVCGTFEERAFAPEETGSSYYGMCKGVTGPRGKVTATFADGREIRFHLDADWGPGLGCIFVGEKGRIEINRDKISSDKPELIEGPDRPPAQTIPESQLHIENWVECIKTRERCTADIEYGQRSSTLCYLVNIVREVNKPGEVFNWDPKAERFTNCDAGNDLLSRPRRAGFELPA